MCDQLELLATAKPELKQADTQIKNVITISFDGGCNPNPGNKYGSYQIRRDGKIIGEKIRFTLGHGTSNEAEFDALILALDALNDYCEFHSLNKADINVFILTDSTIVRNRINYTRRRADKNERSRAMTALTDLCKQKLQGFASFQANWNPRRHNVETFGH